MDAHRGSMEMARVLVTYIDCPHRIRHAIMGEFDKAPSITTLANMRRDYLAPKPEQEPIRKNDGYYPGDISRNLEETSRRFLARIEAERKSSAALRRAMVAYPGKFGLPPNHTPKASQAA